MMSFKKAFLMVLIPHLVVLTLICLPYALKPNLGLEILMPGIFNICLLVFDLLAIFGISMDAYYSKKYTLLKAYALVFGIMLIVSVPFCMATAEISSLIHR